MGKLRESWKVYPAGFGQLLRPGQRQSYVTEGAIYRHDYGRHARGDITRPLVAAKCMCLNGEAEKDLIRTKIHRAAFIIATFPYYSHGFVTTIIILSRSTFYPLRCRSIPLQRRGRVIKVQTETMQT